MTAEKRQLELVKVTLGGVGKEGLVRGWTGDSSLLDQVAKVLKQRRSQVLAEGNKIAFKEIASAYCGSSWFRKMRLAVLGLPDASYTNYKNRAAENERIIKDEWKEKLQAAITADSKDGICAKNEEIRGLVYDPLLSVSEREALLVVFKSGATVGNAVDSKNVQGENSQIVKLVNSFLSSVRDWVQPPRVTAAHNPARPRAFGEASNARYQARLVETNNRRERVVGNGDEVSVTGDGSPRELGGREGAAQTPVAGYAGPVEEPKTPAQIAQEAYDASCTWG